MDTAVNMEDVHKKEIEKAIDRAYEEIKSIGIHLREKAEVLKEMFPGISECEPFLEELEHLTDLENDMDYIRKQTKLIGYNSDVKKCISSEMIHCAKHFNELADILKNINETEKKQGEHV